MGVTVLKMEAKRQRLAKLLCTQVPVMPIMETVTCSENFMYTVKRKVESRESLKRKVGSGGHNLKVTDDFLVNLMEKIESNPEHSMRNMVKDLNVKKGTICNVVGKIGLNSYVWRRRQLLSTATKNSRVEHGKGLIS